MEKNAEKWRKEKNIEVSEMYVTIFPLFLSYFSSSSSSSSLLHYIVEVMRGLSGWKQLEKGVGKENKAKTTSFWPFFLKKHTPKWRCFNLFFFKIKMSKQRFFGPKKK